MGLSTHVLDTMHGKPAEGMEVVIYKIQDSVEIWIQDFILNIDGRHPNGLIYDNNQLIQGTYRLVFNVASYFKHQGITLPEPPFLNQVTIDFGVADSSAHYHVPLLVSPWSYSTYRGS